MEKSNLYPLPHDLPPAFEWSPIYRNGGQHNSGLEFDLEKRLLRSIEKPLHENVFYGIYYYMYSSMLTAFALVHIHNLSSLLENIKFERKEKQINTHLIEGRIHYQLQNYNKASDLLYKGLSLFKQEKQMIMQNFSPQFNEQLFLWEQYENYHLAKCYLELSRFQDCLNVLFSIISVLETVDNKRNNNRVDLILVCYYSIILVSLTQSIELAKENRGKLEEFLFKYNINTNEIKIFNNICLAYVYKAENNFNHAEVHILEALRELQTSRKSRSLNALSLGMLADIYLCMGDYDKAYKHWAGELNLVREKRRKR